jgi:hypothetical protein
VTRADSLAPSFQWRTTNLVNAQGIDPIKVDVSDLNSSWEAAARAAMAEWNNLSSEITFIEGSPADITLISGGTPPCAVASWPDGSGGTGPTINVDETNQTCGATAGTRLRIMVHEFGHTIGFRHTNWVGLGETASPEGAIQIPATPATDGASVMNGNTGGLEYSGFSSYDVIALHKIYPLSLNVVINGLSEIQENHTCWWIATVDGDYPPYTYLWERSETNVWEFGGTEDLYETEGQVGLDFLIRVTVTDSLGRTRRVTKPITVLEEAPTPWQWCN